MKAMFSIKNLTVTTLVLLTSFSLFGQDTESDDDLFTISTPITIDLGDKEEEEEVVEIKKKKRKKKVFYGLKTRKGFSKKGVGNRQVLELYYVLKKFEKPETFVRDIYWYDYRRKEVRKGGKIDPKFGAILHGPYKKMRGEVILEEGIFYKGTKHGRWMTHDKNDILVDKEKYFKGWPKESKVRYYNPKQRTKMKEIIPIEYGEKEGYYYYLYENGQIAVRGEYKWDHPVGDWEERYASGRRKKIIRYSKDPYDKNFTPYTWKEWNKKGKLIYQKK